MIRYAQWTVAQLIRALQALPQDQLFNVRLDDEMETLEPLLPAPDGFTGGGNGPDERFLKAEAGK